MLNHKRSRSKSRGGDESPIKKAKIEEIVLENSYENLLQKVYIYDNSTKVNCKICTNDISKNIKFICNTCNDFIFCINCLVNEEPHDVKQKASKNHDYHIVDKLNFHVFTSDWNASEELQLLTGK